jgi:hypothetical protein
MPRLDGHQPTEPAAEHKDRPDPKRTPGGEENDAKPANGIPVDCPKLNPVGIGRQVAGQQTYQREGNNDPAVRTILAFTGAEISAAEEGYARHHESCGRKGNQGRVGEEGLKPAPAKDSQPEISKGRHHGDEC